MQDIELARALLPFCPAARRELVERVERLAAERPIHFLSDVPDAPESPPAAPVPSPWRPSTVQLITPTDFAKRVSTIRRTI